MPNDASDQLANVPVLDKPAPMHSPSIINASLVAVIARVVGLIVPATATGAVT